MKKYLALGALSFLPAVAFAQISATGGIDSVFNALQDLFNYIFPILLLIAVFIIIWGIFQFILNAGDEEARKSGRSKILWGIVGVFLMLSVWGLINILVNTINVDRNAIYPNDIF